MYPQRRAPGPLEVEREGHREAAIGIEEALHLADSRVAGAAHELLALTSPAAQRTTPNYHAVGIAKAALTTALLYLGAELGPRGILCNGVGFSLIETDGARRAVGEKLAVTTRTFLQKRAPTRSAMR